MFAIAFPFSRANQGKSKPNQLLARDPSLATLLSRVSIVIAIFSHARRVLAALPTKVDKPPGGIRTS